MPRNDSISERLEDLAGRLSMGVDPWSLEAAVNELLDIANETRSLGTARYPDLPPDLLEALRDPQITLAGEHKVYERVAQWVKLDGSTAPVQSNTPALPGEDVR